MSVTPQLRKKMEKRRKELSQKGGGFKSVGFKEGTTRIRILPCPADMEFGVEATFYFIDNKSIISPATFGEPCALMEAYNRLKDSKDEDDKIAAKLVQPKRRYFVVACRYLDDKGLKLDTETGAKLHQLTNQVYQDIIDLYLDEQEAGDMTDPLKGYDLKIKRTGSGQFDTEYNVIACKPTKRPIQFKGKLFDPKEELRKIASTYDETVELVEKVLGSSEPPKKKLGLKKKKKISSK
jgi:hypothetical protein